MAKSRTVPSDGQSGIPLDTQSSTTFASAMNMRMIREGGNQYQTAMPRYASLNRPSLVGDEGLRRFGPNTFFDFYINVIQNPDWTRNLDPSFDEKVANHPDVAAAIRKRSITVASFPIGVEASGRIGVDRVVSQQIADYVDQVLNGIDSITETVRQLIAGGTLYGGRGREFVWTQDANGIERPTEAWDVHGSRIGFDVVGNMSIFTTQAPVWGAYIKQEPTTLKEGVSAIPAPPGRFIYYKYMAEGGAWERSAFEGFNYHGRGENTRLYVPVTFDYYMWRFQMKFAEKHGMPTTVLYYPEVSPVSNTDIVTSIRDEAVITLPRFSGKEGRNSMYDIEFIQPSGMGWEIYHSSHERFTQQIEKILLGGANLMQLAEVGGYNASEGQRDAGETVIFMYDALRIASVLTNQLVPHIVRAVPAWSKLPDVWMPTVNLMPHKMRNKLQELSVIQQAAMMVPVREDDIYAAAGLIRPRDGRDGQVPDNVVFLGQPPQDMFNGFPAGGDQPSSQSIQQQETELRKSGKDTSKSGREKRSSK